MVESTNKQGEKEELPDYDIDVYEFIEGGDEAGATGVGGGDKAGGAQAKPSDYVGVHSTSFKDMLLKPEL